jgi:saccharopine dehydrogenase-like NADP-dependent oxidoreductase
VQDSFVRKIYPQLVAGQMRSAIQLTTASSLCAMLELLAEGKLPQRGFVRQEDVRLQDFMANRFGRVYGAAELRLAA